MKDCFRNFLISIFTFWLIGFPCHLLAQETTASLSNPNDLFWSQLGSLEKPAPVEEMSPSQIAQQQELNKLYGHEFVLSYSHYSDSLLFPENNYDLPVTLRRIDNEPITPYNWWWISLELEEPGGQVLTAHLRRPNWWIANNDAREIGNLVYLNLPEMAISGWSKVTGIRPSYIDTRVATFDSEGNYCYRPITGWFSRMAPETRDFFFSTGDTIGATPNHLFFSETRQEYVPAGELEIGEQVKLVSGEAASFIGKGARSAGPEQVYNLEVWRGHNYYVGNYGLLVHNDCDLGDIRDGIKRFKKGEFPLSDPPTRFQKVVEKLAELGDNHLEQFLVDFKGTNGKIGLGVFDEGMVEAWKSLYYTGLRSNTYWLKRISRWSSSGFFFTFSESGSKVKVLRNGIQVAEICDELQYFKVILNGFGGGIYCPLDQTVTILGLYHPNEPFVGTWYLIEDLKLFKTGSNPGGLNLLSVPNWSWDLNRDWLYEAAMVRGDVIRIISDPFDPKTIWDNGIPPGLPGHNGIKTITGLEIEFLAGYGFVYDPEIPGYYKP